MSHEGIAMEREELAHRHLRAKPLHCLDVRLDRMLLLGCISLTEVRWVGAAVHDDTIERGMEVAAELAPATEWCWMISSGTATRCIVSSVWPGCPSGFFPVLCRKLRVWGSWRLSSPEDGGMRLLWLSFASALGGS